jgi:membrane associated rhomboid family serine protease
MDQPDRITQGYFSSQRGDNDDGVSSSFMRRRLLLSALVPFLFVAIAWLVMLYSVLFGTDLFYLGIYPRTAEGLPGVIFCPFIHSSAAHLGGNTLPLLFLGTAAFYFYRNSAFKVAAFVWIFSGAVTWLLAREAWHIGASGIVYGLASFLFFSGIIRKNFRLMALSLLIVFLYGSMVWGMFPEIYRDVSWEGHAAGFIAGIIMAIVYRNEGPSERRPAWMDEDEDLEKEENVPDITIDEKN